MVIRPSGFELLAAQWHLQGEMLATPPDNSHADEVHMRYRCDDVIIDDCGGDKRGAKKDLAIQDTSREI
ncbi:hypothetical protein AB9F27_21510 [Falsihalocynthiibacter sp. CO-5D18]|jgi:hypothetical protein